MDARYPAVSDAAVRGYRLLVSDGLDATMSGCLGRPSPRRHTTPFWIASLRFSTLSWSLGLRARAVGRLLLCETSGQVNFCRGLTDSVDGHCVDLVLDLEAMPDWRITDVRYDGFPSERWRLTTPSDPDLEGQLTTLVRTLAADLQ